MATKHVEVVAGERSGVAQILVYADGDNSIAGDRGALAVAYVLVKRRGLWEQRREKE